MDDYLRIMTVTDREIPLIDLQKAARHGAIWSIDLPSNDGNYLVVGPVVNQTEEIWATIERNLVGPGTLGAEEVAEFMDTLDQGGPPSAGRWLTDYLESVRAIYAIRIYPDAMKDDPKAFETVYELRTALHRIIGGIGRWGDLGYTNDQDRLIWCRLDRNVSGMTAASMLDEFSGRWIEIEVNLDDPTEFQAFQNGEILSIMKDRVKA
ncbi:MAG: hypothetical protein WCJ40_00575 [Planctomycetota bacterium]|nr:hypothetical protein [Planctomycetota bacterium]RLT09276.1 MAG: hypothetical protein DWI24_09960 [Planctomycetota bacterium]